MYCDNVEQQIVYFTSDPFPLVRGGADRQRSFDQVRRPSAKKSDRDFRGFGPADEVALVTYDQFPNTVADFSFNNDQLFTKLKRLDLAFPLSRALRSADR